MKPRSSNQPSASALVRSTRKDLAWVPDEKLPELEYREAPMAVGLAVISGGGGHLYTGDVAKGIKGILAMGAAFVASAILPASISVAPILGVAIWGALGSWRQARLINRYINQNRNAKAEQTQTPVTQQLLASMNAPSSPENASEQSIVRVENNSQCFVEHAELMVRLRKLSSIHASGVLTDGEFRARKIDLLSDVGTGLSALETESLLYALIPLLDDGTVNEEDMQFVKELGS